MHIHAIQTGQVRIKSAQVQGRGHGVARQLAIFRDAEWTDWLPPYAWAIEHPDGVIVVDTGQGAHLLRSGHSLHPYLRWQVEFRIEPEEEVGPQLRRLGIGARDVTRVVLTHLHVDHDGGLAHFPETEILVPRGELAAAQGMLGRIRGYLPQRWPAWFDPVALDLDAGPFGPFAASAALTKAGDVRAVATPGHTPHHISVVVQDGSRAIVLAGDASYTEALMLSGLVDGVSPDEVVSRRTLAQVAAFARMQPTVYLPTHDPGAATRLTTGAASATPPLSASA